MTDPAPWGDEPLPPELASPDDAADAWLEQVADAGAQLADDTGMDPDAAGALLAIPAHESAEGYAARALVPEAAQRWTVTDDRSAEWAMRHVVAATAEIERLRDQADNWEARIHQWFTHRANPLLAKVAFMEAHLERHAIALRAADPKRKTLVLPSGAVRTTSSAPKVVISNAGAAFTWACAHARGALVPRQAELQVSKLREHVRPVQLVTEAELTFSCGHRTPRRDPNGLALPDVGTEVECEHHGPVLLGRVDVAATRWVPLCTADGTLGVGVEVDPGGVTAKVVPAP